MRFIRYLAGVTLAVLTPLALAESPFQVGGLHTELVFSDAMAMVEKLGATCRVKPPRTEGGDTSAQCVFLPVDERDEAGESAKQSTHAPGLSIGSKPILRIGMEAPAETALLTRIVFLFDGDIEAVAETLIQQFGQPTGLPSQDKSWSHSRRRSWNQGIYGMGLLNSPDMIILSAHRQPSNPGAT